MKFFLALMFISSATYAAPMTDTQSPSTSKVYDSEVRKNTKTQEPSAIPCPPQQTRSDKLDDLAKLEGQGESHSTNCPGQGAIKETPEKTIH